MKPIRVLVMLSGIVMAAAVTVASETTLTVSATVEDGILTGWADVTYAGPPVASSVGTDPTGDFADDPDVGALAGPLGIDITDLQIRTPSSGAVEFIIRVADLAVPPPNEVIRYLWQFTVDGKEYWVQAKTSDLSTVVLVDDPAGAATHVQGAFRLRGNCGPLGPLNNCAHLLWLDGVFDVERDEVRIRVPIGAPEAPDFVPGAEIAPDPEGITASIQVVVSNESTSDTAFQEDVYVIPSISFSGDFAIGAPGEDPSGLEYTFGSSVGAMCSFSGAGGGDPEEGVVTCAFEVTGDVSDLTPGEYDLVAKACTPDGCSFGSTTFVV